MGLFGSKKAPTLDLSGVRRAIEGIESFDPAFGRSEERAGRIAPLALGARESALADIATPESTTAFFQGFQPTSLEAALADQTFQNIFPDVERSIKQNLSLSGIASSPILAQQIGRARGELGVDIGNILAQLGQERGVGSLNARLGIDPFGNVLLPQTQQDLAQANLKQQAFIQLEQQQAFANFQQAQQDAQSKAQGISGLGSLIGGGLGLLAAPFTGGLSLAGGAALGGSLGGAAAGLFGGAQSPISLGDALSVSQAFPGTGGGQGFGGGQPTTFGTTGRRAQSVFGGSPVNLPLDDFSLGNFGFGR